jgi:hypothetical protein
MFAAVTVGISCGLGLSNAVNRALYGSINEGLYPASISTLNSFLLYSCLMTRYVFLSLLLSTYISATAAVSRTKNTAVVPLAHIDT